MVIEFLIACYIKVFSKSMLPKMLLFLEMQSMIVTQV